MLLHGLSLILHINSRCVKLKLLDRHFESHICVHSSEYNEFRAKLDGSMIVSSLGFQVALDQDSLVLKIL